jgi:hypothetical protein
MEYAEVVEKLKNNRYSEVYCADQLKKEMEANNVFVGFTEGDLKFRPTYRLERTTDEWSNKRFQPPSWTDRVLVRSLPGLEDRMKLSSYNGCPRMKGSDHRPVTAIFAFSPRRPYKGLAPSRLKQLKTQQPKAPAGGSTTSATMIMGAPAAGIIPLKVDFVFYNVRLEMLEEAPKAVALSFSADFLNDMVNTPYVSAVGGSGGSTPVAPPTPSSSGTSSSSGSSSGSSSSGSGGGGGQFVWSGNFMLESFITDTEFMQNRHVAINITTKATTAPQQPKPGPTPRGPSNSVDRALETKASSGGVGDKTGPDKQAGVITKNHIGYVTLACSTALESKVPVGFKAIVTLGGLIVGHLSGKWCVRYAK